MLAFWLGKYIEKSAFGLELDHLAIFAELNKASLLKFISDQCRGMGSGDSVFEHWPEDFRDLENIGAYRAEVSDGPLFKNFVYRLVKCPLVFFRHLADLEFWDNLFFLLWGCTNSGSLLLDGYFGTRLWLFNLCVFKRLRGLCNCFFLDLKLLLWHNFFLQWRHLWNGVFFKCHRHQGGPVSLCECLVKR